MRRPMTIIRDAVDEDFWKPRPRQINWYGVAGLAVMAMSGGFFAGWIYTVYRLLQLS